MTSLLLICFLFLWLISTEERRAQGGPEGGGAGDDLQGVAGHRDTNTGTECPSYYVQFYNIVLYKNWTNYILNLLDKHVFF